MSIGSRLNEFAKSKYGDKHGYKTLFASDLEITRDTLSRYLSDKLNLSNNIQSKLRELGCDIEWLMTGREKVTVGAREVSVYPREEVEQAGAIPIEHTKSIIHQLTDEIKSLQARNSALEQELHDKKEIITLLKEKIVLLGNENTKGENPVGALQKIK